MNHVQLMVWFITKFEGPAVEVLNGLKQLRAKIEEQEEAKKVELYEDFIELIPKININKSNAKLVHLIATQEYRSMTKLRVEHTDIASLVQHKIDEFEKILKNEHLKRPKEEYLEIEYCAENNQILTRDEEKRLVSEFELFINTKLFLIQRERC